MNKKRSGMIFLAFGLVAAVIVGGLVYSISRTAASQKVETVGVLVALQEIPERTVITPALIGVKQVLPDAIPAGTLSTIEQANGKMTTARIYQGEILHGGRIVDASGKSGIAFNLTKGRVLISLPASDIVLTNAIKVGDHVDLLATYIPDDTKQATPVPAGTPTAKDAQPALEKTLEEMLPRQTQSMLRDLVIVSVGSVNITTAAPDGGTITQPVSAAQNPASSLITFAVEENDALMLKALKDDTSAFKLELVLRAAGDNEITRTEPVTLKSIVDRYGLTQEK